MMFGVSPSNSASQLIPLDGFAASGGFGVWDWGPRVRWTARPGPRAAGRGSAMRWAPGPARACAR